MDRIQHATVFATQAHAGQKRKYTGDDYIVHPIAVAELVSLNGGDEDQIIAALLHDTVEDCDVTVEEIEQHFGMAVAALVEELTDVFTHEAYPDNNRAQRKAWETERLAKVSHAAKLIKLCDMIDNTSTIVEHDPGFAKVYLGEKLALYSKMELDILFPDVKKKVDKR
jgi:(p)ppGpp synthase/HD superfamily hydrolase